MLKTVNGFSVLLLVILQGLFQPANAGVSASGEFIASKSCQAYQSMRKKTNPDATTLSTGKSYPIIELNVPDGTTWFRIKIDGAEPQARWVYFECGHAYVTDKDSSDAGKAACNIAGQADSYVFAVSWQPAFCESHPKKPECQVSNPNAYQANNFTLHGLWPNKRSCGTHYGFCGQYKKRVKPFCDFKPVPMQKVTLEELGVVMPSTAYGSCLQRHEWYKHGTCQTEWDADEYFDMAMSLLAVFNSQGMSDFMVDRIGKQVASDEFFTTIDQLFGDGAHQRMRFNCSSGNLVDIYIHLPLKIDAGLTLSELIHQADPMFDNKCGTSFTVDAIGQ